MQPPLRIAILEADTPIPAVKEEYGSYGVLFSALLRKGADTLAVPNLSSSTGLVLSSFDVVTEQVYPADADVDAVLITGSKYDSFATDVWTEKLVAYTRRLLTETKIRVLGACFGHQIIARALGAGVGRSDRGWELGCVDVGLSDKGKALFGKDKLTIHQMHQDVVYNYPEGVESLGATSVCETQGMYARGRLISVQGHPEFNGPIQQQVLDSRVALGRFSQAIYEEASTRSQKQHDGVAVAAAFLKFLLED